MTEPTYPRLSPFGTGFACRCPRCGRGRLFSGFLTLEPRCDVCGLDYAAADSGDGPAFFAMWTIAIVIVGLAALVEFTVAPPLLLHMVLWTPAILGGAALLLRPYKATLIALQFKHRIYFDDDARQDGEVG